MSIRVYSRFLDLLFEIDRYQSLQYKRSYHGIGDFELHVNRYINGADTLEKGHLIALNKRNNKVGIILSKEIALDEGSKETENFKLTGYTLDGLMQRRITVPPSHTSHDRKSGSAESVMKHYVYNNFINTESARQMPFLEIADNQSRGEHIKYESRYKTVSDELENMSISTGLGWGIFANFNTKKLIFDVIEVRDLTQGNRQGNNPVFFSPEFETIKSQEFIDSDHELRNVGFVGGQGEGVDRKIVKIGDAHGWDRIETFVDARDISDEDEESEEELTDEEVEELLTDRGKKKMSDMETIFTLEAEILTPTKKSVYEYEKDFDLGDRVDVVNKSWNLKMTAPITELLEIYEPGGFRLEATFGRNRPTLISKLKDKFDELEGVEKQEAPERVSVTNLKEAKKYAREQDENVREDAQDFADDAEEKSKEHTEDYTYPKDTIDKKDKANKDYTDALMEGAQREINDTKERITQAEKDLGEADKKVDKAVEDVERLEKELEDLDLDFEIGGVNLLRNSELISHKLGDLRQTLTTTGVSSGTYTLSFDYDVSDIGGEPSSFLIYTDRSVARVPLKRAGQNRAHLTFEITESDQNKPIYLYFGSGAGESRANEGEFIEVQLEKGTKATSYQRSPEDIQAEIDKANERINTANKDIKSAQDLIDSVTEDKNGQTVLKGTLITNELIAEDATLTGSFKGANATIDDLTTKNMTAINAIIQSAYVEGTLDAAKATFKQGTFDKATIQDAVIKGELGANEATILGLTTKQMTAINATIKDATVTGSLNASDAIFQKGRFNEATIVDAIIENATITGEMVGVTGTFSGDINTTKNAVIGKSLKILQSTNEDSSLIFEGFGGETGIKRLNSGDMLIFNDDGNIMVESLRVLSSSDFLYDVAFDDRVYFNSVLDLRSELRFDTTGSSHRIATGSDGSFTFAGNRGVGSPFEVKSHSNTSSYRTDMYIHQTQGNIVSQPTADRTSTGATNLRIGASNGQFVRTTSSAKHKLLIEEISLDPYRIMDAIPSDWFDKDNSEVYAECLTANDIERMIEVESIRRTPGFIAEQIEKIGLQQFVEYNSVTGEVEGVMYDRIWILLIPIIKNIISELEELKNGRS